MEFISDITITQKAYSIISINIIPPTLLNWKLIICGSKSAEIIGFFVFQEFITFSLSDIGISPAYLDIVHSMRCVYPSALCPTGYYIYVHLDISWKMDGMNWFFEKVEFSSPCLT